MPQEPDVLGKSIRFGCGALFGVALGLYTLLRLVPDPWYTVALGTILVSMLCGYLAMVYGDDFWSWIAEHRWWL